MIEQQFGDENRSHNHSMPCVFCEIVQGKVPASIITESQNTLVIVAKEDGYPLILTKTHISDVFDPRLDISTQQEIGVMSVSLARTVKDVDGVTGVTIASNNGVNAGQEIPHLHFHIVPRFPGDRKIRIVRGTTLLRAEMDERAQSYIAGLRV